MRLSAVAFLALAMPLQAQTLPVFSPDDEGRPFVDVYASGLYSATCMEGAGCTCAAMPIDREGLAVALGLEEVAGDVQGVWTSPASDSTLTSETADALHARFGGSGYCPQTPLEPADGLWREGAPTSITVQCGPGTAMFRQMLATRKPVTARLVWNGAFSGDVIQNGFIAADPDPERAARRHVFENLTPVETLGTASIAADGGAMSSAGRMRLLTPRLFAVHWEVQGTTEMGPCNWSTDQLVSWVGE